MDEKLREVYYNVGDPSGFASIKKLYDSVKQSFPQLTIKYVREWLSAQKPYSLLRSAKYKFKRNRVLVASVNEEFQADLLDVRNLSTSNKNVRFLLTVVDVLSKYAYAIPLKNKTAHAVRNAFAQIFKERVPAIVQTDDGNEFKGTVKTLFDEYNILHVVANDAQIKCSVAERFNKTLRLKIAKYLRHTNKRTYIDVLEKIVSAYNRTVHSQTRMRPIDVTIETQQTAFDNLYGGKTYREMLLENYRKKAKLSVGDFVRLKLFKKTFGRGYQDNWSTQLYRIVKAYKTGQKAMFKVSNAMNNELSRKYYQEDLQKIMPKVYSVTATNRKRTRAGEVQVEVLYDGIKTPQWIPETSLFHDE